MPGGELEAHSGRSGVGQAARRRRSSSSVVVPAVLRVVVVLLHSSGGSVSVCNTKSAASVI